MGLSEFVLELLVPGLVSIAVGILLAIEFDVDVNQDLSSGATTILITSVFVVAYLVGIAFRHAIDHLQSSHSTLYWEQLTSSWRQELSVLGSRWLTENEQARVEQSEEISVSDAGEIVRRMEQYYLSTGGDAWGEQIHYNRNIARVSSNSFYPLLLIAGVTAVGSSRRAFETEFGTAGIYLVGLVLSILVAAGLRRAHNRRIKWNVDSLVRTDIAHQLRRPRI